VSAPSAQDSGQQETRPLTHFGARLKEQREKRGITLDQISKSTKIGTRFLEALEEDHFDRLPGGIFNKGFVRAYARSVGLDADQAVTDYLAATGANQLNPEALDQAPLPEPPPEVKRPRSAGFPWGTIATLLLILAFSFAVWGFFSRVTSNREKEPTQAPRSQTSSTTSHTLSQPSANASDSGASASAQPAVVTGSSQPPVAANSSAPQTDSTSTPISREIILRIKAREDSWLSITVDGEVTSEQTLSASEEKTVRARNGIVIRTGNIGALDFTFQGKQLPPQGEPGEVKTLAFDANGWHAVPKPPATKQPEPQP
jgi:cytoskeleton protein RodZ